MASVGVAMIARNGAQTMETALKPFIGLVDEIAIVLGGKSRDKTAKIAKKLADKVENFSGELDAKGRLKSFAAARQQSFNLLSTDWAIVVDTDDKWGGVETLRTAIDDAEEKGCDGIWVKYLIGRSVTKQPRVFRRDRGFWQGDVHESFRLYNEDKLLQTPFLTLTQEEKEDKADRLDQDIAINKGILEREPDNRRALAHLVQDFLKSGDLGQSIVYGDRYLELWQAAEDQKPGDEELLFVCYNKAIAELHNGQFIEAAQTAELSLSVKESGHAWCILAEATLKKISQPGQQALHDLVIFACDKAIQAGRPRFGFTVQPSMSAETPCLIKGLALASAGKWREALAACDLGLAISPDHSGLTKLQYTICEELQEMP